MDKPEQKVINAIQILIDDTPLSFAIKLKSSVSTGILLDLIGAYRGVPFYIEAKASDGNTSPLQRTLVNYYSRCGYVTGVVKSIDEFKELFDNAWPMAASATINRAR